MDKQPIIGQAPEEEKKDDPRVLLAQIAYVNHVQRCATSRKERVEALMQRRSAKKWDAKKKARMVRKLMTANQELEQTTTALTDLLPRFEALRQTVARVNDVAPFVKGPATSEIPSQLFDQEPGQSGGENPFGG
jgi:hypothetical protein